MTAPVLIVVGSLVFGWVAVTLLDRIGHPVVWLAAVIGALVVITLLVGTLYSSLGGA